MSLKFYGRETGDVMSLQFLVLVFFVGAVKTSIRKNIIA